MYVNWHTFSYDYSMLYAKYLLGRDDFSGAQEWAEKAKTIKGYSLEVRIILIVFVSYIYSNNLGNSAVSFQAL